METGLGGRHRKGNQSEIWVLKLPESHEKLTRFNKGRREISLGEKGGTKSSEGALLTGVKWGKNVVGGEKNGGQFSAIVEDFLWMALGGGARGGCIVKDHSWVKRSGAILVSRSL